MTHVVHYTGQSTIEFVFEFRGNKPEVQLKKGEVHKGVGSVTPHPNSWSELVNFYQCLFVYCNLTRATLYPLFLKVKDCCQFSFSCGNYLNSMSLNLIEKNVYANLIAFKMLI